MIPIIITLIASIAIIIPIDIAAISIIGSIGNGYVVSEDNAYLCRYYNSDGTKMYAFSTINDNICEYDLSTPYDERTATYNNI